MQFLDWPNILEASESQLNNPSEPVMIFTIVPLAQWLEREALTFCVVGSNPTGDAKI